MAQNKTTETTASVADFINTVADESKKADSFSIIQLFEDATGLPAKMWGPAIVGFGSYHYKYESGREGDAPLTGFSPRKDAFALYLSSSFPEREEMLKKLGKHKTAKACVYIKKVADVNTDVLKQMIAASIKQTKSKYS